MTFHTPPYHTNQTEGLDNIQLWQNITGPLQQNTNQQHANVIQYKKDKIQIDKMQIKTYKCENILKVKIQM